MFQQAVEFNPQFYPAWIELGNLQAQRAEREVAIHAFEQALASLPQVGAFRAILIDHLAQLRSTPDVTQVRPVRDPFDE